MPDFVRNFVRRVSDYYSPKGRGELELLQDAGSDPMVDADSPPDIIRRVKKIEAWIAARPDA